MLQCKISRTTMKTATQTSIETLDDLAKLADYSFMEKLNCDPHAREDGVDHDPREVFSGHYVTVKPTPIKEPVYVAHSTNFFQELGFADTLAKSEDFMRMFSGDMSQVPDPMKKVGWATGYALSIFGNEYYQQCPFKTGNGYGDGRAVSVLEAVINGKRWEMQLKGGGRTPYCRGADGKAVLRSSVREFLAQEHMHALGIPTSRSLSLFTSKIQKVQRPWFSENSHSKDPDMMVSEAVAISTRVAPSFIRVGQLELFARRTRKNEHPKAKEELKQIVLHLIEREYSDVIEQTISLEEQILKLANEFAKRLSSLVTNWIRVGFCQGNFNSDNCAAGGFTLDFGPFGFIDMFDPNYQSWTGGGEHFAFLNQAQAAQRNFHSFCSALEPLLADEQSHLEALKKIEKEFPKVMQTALKKMWTAKLGLTLETFDADLLRELHILMMRTSVDYTIFFRELSKVPNELTALQKSFYNDISHDEKMQKHWEMWFEKWKALINHENKEELSKQMKQVNPKYILREWFLVPAYKEAQQGNYDLLKELQKVMTMPYDEQSKEIEKKYYGLKPSTLFELAGVSFVSCSS